GVVQSGASGRGRGPRYSLAGRIAFHAAACRARLSARRRERRRGPYAAHPVGLAVQVLPLANPLRVAEEAAIVDHISEGRLIFGVGRSSFLESYQGYNVEYAESRAMFLESLAIIRQAWGEAPFSYAGKYYQFRDVNLVPKPYQQPHPPIRVAVESRD